MQKITGREDLTSPITTAVAGAISSGSFGCTVNDEAVSGAIASYVDLGLADTIVTDAANDLTYLPGINNVASGNVAWDPAIIDLVTDTLTDPVDTQYQSGILGFINPSVDFLGNYDTILSSLDATNPLIAAAIADATADLAVTTTASVEQHGAAR